MKILSAILILGFVGAFFILRNSFKSGEDLDLQYAPDKLFVGFAPEIKIEPIKELESKYGLERIRLDRKLNKTQLGYYKIASGKPAKILKEELKKETIVIFADLVPAIYQ